MDSLSETCMELFTKIKLRNSAPCLLLLYECWRSNNVRVNQQMCNWLEISDVLAVSVSRKVCNIGFVHSNFLVLFCPADISSYEKLQT